MIIKVSVFKQRGYKCGGCEVVTIVYDDTFKPSQCSNCGSNNFKLLWHNKVKETVEVEPIKKDGEI